MKQTMFLIDSYIKHEQDNLEKALASSNLKEAKDKLVDLHQYGWEQICKHGDFKRWLSGFEALPIENTQTSSYADVVCVGHATETQVTQNIIEEALHKFRPWRKGPFQIFSVDVDAEWRSDLKWNRIESHISSLQGRTILDIGCGSGYHLWRMLEDGADLVLGVDTSPLFAFHFAIVKRYQPQAAAFYLPASIDDMPQETHAFDTVFSMGVLYHRKEPLSHLLRIKDLLCEGGEMVLETLVIEGDEQTCLIPKGRYAKMRNVWFIPSVAMLTLWLERLGFKDIRCVDVNVTSVEEQRVTDWMQFESLVDYLDPNDRSKTIEGYPAPCRATLVATV